MNYHGFLNNWYIAKDYFCLCRISFLSDYKGVVMVFLTNGRGLPLKDFKKEFKVASVGDISNALNKDNLTKGN